MPLQELGLYATLLHFVIRSFVFQIPATCVAFFREDSVAPGLATTILHVPVLSACALPIVLENFVRVVDEKGIPYKNTE